MYKEKHILNILDIIIVGIGILVLILLLIYVTSLLKKEKIVNLAKMDATDEIIFIQSKLSDYKVSYVDDKLITGQTATPLDNIAYFMTKIYPTLSDNIKSKCNYVLFIYSENLMELLNQIFKEPVANDPKETDAWYNSQAKEMSELYIRLMMNTYDDEIKAHEDEFNQLSTYEYMAMQKQIEVWKLENSYTINKKIDNGGA